MANLSLSIAELENFAEVLQTRVISDPAELVYGMHHRIADWCRSRHGIAVLENGDIITSNPAAAEVNECQRHLEHHGMVCGDIYPATDVVIQHLINHAMGSEDLGDHQFSESRQQLRVLIRSAIKMGASDIHLTIIPTIKQSVVRFRIHGSMSLYAKWTDDVGIKVHSVAYNHLSSNKQDAFSMILPQDMSFTEHFEEYGDIRIRSSNIGIKNGGCKIIYRLLSVGSDDTPTPDSLGYPPSQLNLIKMIPNLGNGIVLFCGETGSGKTTSLASVLSMVDRRKTVYSVEDPVEKYIDNVDQCPVDTRDAKRNFAYYLRALLRADPDVIMVGEIRDEETAKIAIQGALTGHLILSTLHTCHAVNAVMRLQEQGIPADHMATPGLLRMIVAQQLYPVLCPECARPLTKDEKKQISFLYQKDELEQLKTTDKKKSCKSCQGSGTAGRRVYAEIIKIDRRSREFIRNMDIRGWEKYLESNGFITLDNRVHHDLLNGKIDAFSLKVMEAPEEEVFKYGGMDGGA